MEAAPTPRSAFDIQRWAETGLRRRILYGLWEDDARDRIRRELASVERAEAWGDPDLTGDLLTPICQHQSALYTPDPPRVTAPETGDVVLDALTTAGLWELLVRGQRDTIGMREWMVRVDPVADPTAPLGQGLQVRPAFGDRIVAEPHATAADQPGHVEELYQDAEGRWWWDVWHADGKSEPYHEYRDANGTVVVDLVHPREAGEAYPYRDDVGAPVLPYSIYHAERTGQLWDSWQWHSIVDGSMSVMVLWTFYRHCVRSASWPQRYMMGVTPSTDVRERTTGGNGSSESKAPPRRRAVADPALVLPLYPTDDNIQPQIGQWSTSTDPAKLSESISSYERRTVALAGISPADIQRVTGDPRSGYALEISQTAQAEARRRYEPVFKRADLETIRVAAAVLSSAASAGRPRVRLPGSGYGVAYGPEARAEEALNAGQVQTLIQIATAVSARQIPRDAGVQIVQRALGLPTTQAADALLASAGRG